jgi:ubiquitin-conjugating enzyme E2 Q
MTGTRSTAPKSHAFFERLRHDIMAVTLEKGFQTGYWGDIRRSDTCYFSVAVRIRLLGISGACLRAWGVADVEYLCVLIRFTEGYMPLQEALKNQRTISFRTGIARSYKPSFANVLRAFLPPNTKERAMLDEQAANEDDYWKPSFISRPLDELFNKTFIPIVKLRVAGMSWPGAEAFLDEVQGIVGKDLPNANKYNKPEDLETRHYRHLVKTDHLQGCDKDKASSLRVVLEFAVRHFARCTEFCLVCHRKMDLELQAIKPYVCGRSLCLFQYMTFSFGPSLEHEILTEPYVVDLLVSLCYQSAAVNQLTVFPSGLCLRVPVLGPDPGVTHPKGSSYVFSASKGVQLRTDLLELRYQDDQHGLAEGDWVAIKLKLDDGPASAYYHHRIRGVSGVTVKLAPEGLTSTPMGLPLFKNKFEPVEVRKYKRNFDELATDVQRRVITEQLELLPSIGAMAEYAKGGEVLATWTENISPAALTILRWIISSNRCCIMQVKAEDRIPGMPGYRQFRILMGSPVSSNLNRSQLRNGQCEMVKLTSAGKGASIRQGGERGWRQARVHLRMARQPAPQLAYDHSRRVELQQNPVR